MREREIEDDLLERDLEEVLGGTSPPDLTHVIQARLREQAGAASPRQRALRPSTPRPVRWVALAAALLVATLVGITLGLRWREGPEPDSDIAAPPAPGASHASSPEVPRPPEQPVPPDVTPGEETEEPDAMEDSREGIAREVQTIEAEVSLLLQQLPPPEDTRGAAYRSEAQELLEAGRRAYAEGRLQDALDDLDSALSRCLACAPPGDTARAVPRSHEPPPPAPRPPGILPPSDAARQVERQALIAGRREALHHKLARRLVNLARTAAKNYDLHGLALGLYRQVLEWDPDNHKARRELGYERQEGRWVRSPQERLATLMWEDEPGHEKLLRKVQLHARKLCMLAARDLRWLARQAEQEGLAQEAESLWRELLTFDPDAPEARMRLGHVQLGSGLWVPERVRVQLEHSERVVPMAHPPPFADRFSQDVAFGMQGCTTTHGALTYPAGATPRGVQALADAGEQALLVTRELLQIEAGFVSPRYHFNVLPDVERYRYLVGLCITDEAERRRLEEHISCRSCYPHSPSDVTYLPRGGDVDQTSYIYAHNMTHAAIQANLGSLPLWSSEGLACLVEEIVTSSSDLSCVGADTVAGRPTVRKEGTETRRRVACLDLIREGLDRPLTGVLAAAGADEIGGSGIMKITGLFTLLSTADPGGLARFLRESAGLPAEGQAELFARVFGREIAEMDGWWRFLALGTYEPRKGR